MINNNNNNKSSSRVFYFNSDDAAAVVLPREAPWRLRPRDSDAACCVDHDLNTLFF